jgi:hypothetical protein
VQVEFSTVELSERNLTCFVAECAGDAPGGTSTSMSGTAVRLVASELRLLSGLTGAETIVGVRSPRPVRRITTNARSAPRWRRLA